MQQRQQRDIIHLNIRRVLKDDHGQLFALYKLLGYALHEKQLSERLDDLLSNKEHALYLAELSEGEVVGWIHAYVSVSLYTDPVVYIRELLVDKEIRYIGAEQTLLQVVEQWAREQDCSAVYLWSETMQQKDPRFYQGLGYASQPAQILRKLLIAPDVRVLH